MTYCDACGHQLGVGRFCTSCGRPTPAADAAVGGSLLGDPDSTSQRLPRIFVSADTGGSPAVDTGPHAAARGLDAGVDGSWFSGSPVTAPDAATGARFPLYADEVGAVPAHGRPTFPSAPSSAPSSAVPTAGAPSGGAPGGAGATGRPQRRHGRFLPALVVTLALLLVAAIVGATLLVTGGADERETAGGGGAAGDGVSAPDGGGAGGDGIRVDDPRPLADSARAQATRTADDGNDVAGGRVSYGAENVLDGDPATTWRVGGDGTGESLEFTFDEPVVITSVGMINGYAKVDRRSDGTPVDWYAQNRVVLEARWTFSDGSVVDQDLTRTAQMQRLEIPARETTSVTLRIVDVSEPGGRDNTPISEVELAGAPVSEVG